VANSRKSTIGKTMSAIWQRLILGYLAVISIVVGLWAQFAPLSFYQSFPGFGHVWVGIDGPYNEHLIRDVGGLNLALAAVLVVAGLKLERLMVIAACFAALLYGVPHVIYHLMHRGALGASDATSSLGGLVLFALLPWVLLVAKVREPSSS
jgi:hypothetical protein